MAEPPGRKLPAMADAGIDALMLGRAGNARYVSNAEVLSLTGTRPFAPGCVVVRSTGKVHLLSITDVGIPPTIPHDQLFPITWNPMNLAGNVAAIPGLADASTVGVDGMTPLMEQLLGPVLPRAPFGEAESLLRAVRRPKSVADLDGIRRAVSVTQQCVAATLAAIAPRVTERALL